MQRRVANLEHRVDTNANQIAKSLGVGMVDDDSAESGEGAWRRKLRQNSVGLTHPIDSGAKRNDIARLPLGGESILEISLRLM